MGGGRGTKELISYFTQETARLRYRAQSGNEISGIFCEYYAKALNTNCGPNGENFNFVVNNRNC